MNIQNVWQRFRSVRYFMPEALYGDNIPGRAQMWRLGASLSFALKSLCSSSEGSWTSTWVLILLQGLFRMGNLSGYVTFFNLRERIFELFKKKLNNIYVSVQRPVCCSHQSDRRIRVCISHQQERRFCSLVWEVFKFQRSNTGFGERGS